MNTTIKTAMLAATALTLAAGTARAEWPNDRPIQMIVAFSPGGSTDVMARAMEPYLEKRLGADIVIENRPGASGEIAYTALAKAKPDGYTFSYINTPGFLSMQVQRQLGYDPQAIKPIARIVDDPSAVVVPAASEIKTLKDFVEAAKANPGAVSFGSSGVGTDDHLAIILLGAQTGATFTHIPFSGAGETRTAILGSQITAGGLNVSEFGGNDTSGLRMIGHFGKERSKQLPDVPTAAEQGYEVFMTSERGIAAPRETPDEISQKFAEAVKATLDDPEFQKQAEQLALPLAYLPGTEWEAQMPARLEEFRKIWAGDALGAVMRAAGAEGRRDLPDLLAGVLMIAIGAIGLWAGRSLAFGTPAMMGPGFLPGVMCALLIAIGGFVLVKGLAKPAERLGLVNLRPLAILVLAIAGFAYAAETLGFVVATVWLLVVGSLADQESRWKEIALSTVILTSIGALVFIEGLGVQMPIWPF